MVTDKEKKITREILELTKPKKPEKKPKINIMESILVAIISWTGICGFGFWLYELTGIKFFAYPLGATILACVESYRLIQGG